MIFIINLKRNGDKKQHMIKQLEKTNYSYTFFDAVDGELLNNNDIEYNACSKYRDPYSSKSLTRGEIGCALSHYSVWKKIVDLEINRAIILEDDVEISDEFDTKINNILNGLSNNPYDVLYLGRKKVKPDVDILNDDVIYPGYSYWTCAYIVTLEGAKKLVASKYLENIIPVDEFIPIMFNQSPLLSSYREYYDGDIVALSLKDNLIVPKDGAFLKSDTHDSAPIDVDLTKPYKFGEEEFMVITVGTEMNDGLKRFVKYCEIYGIPHKILGLGEVWNGGDMAAGAGGGQKINLLKRELLKNDDNKLILFTDSYDVIMLGQPEDIIKRYNEMTNFDSQRQIVFAGEKYCWPDKSLQSEYPDCDSQYKYLNSGGFMGYSNDIAKILDNVEDSSDDQLYYTKYYLQHQDKIIIDTRCSIFQCLNGANNDIEINTSKNKVYNKLFKTFPLVVHGNGSESVKLYLNQLENYTGNGWNRSYHNRIKNKDVKSEDQVFVAYFGENEDKIDCFDNVNVYGYGDNINKSVQDFLKSDATHYLYLEEGYVVECKNMLNDLLDVNKNVVAPIFKKDTKLWANFWGELDGNGYYKRSFDYIDIVEGAKRGCWNVPYVTGIYLVRRSVLEENSNVYNKVGRLDQDMSFCYNLRKNNIFMYAINYQYYGYIDSPDNISILDLDKYTSDWEQKYLHPNYNVKNMMYKKVCENAFNFPLFSEKFCEELISIAEKANNWSAGKDNHKDARLSGGYENYPTQDIHLNQIGLEKVWDKIIKNYVAPVASKLYSGYKTKGTNINFVVKYSMAGQMDLKPHHDGSTYTINVALNNKFTGGGCRFIRQNYSLVNKEIGYASIHPGRLTHYHEGLPITSGTRYIMVSFVN